MNDKDAETAMQIIFYAGNAKSSALKSMDLILLGNRIAATKQLEEAKRILTQAHNIQTSLMTAEVNGRQIEKTILLIHAQDQYMAANTEIELAERFIKFWDLTLPKKDEK